MLYPEQSHESVFLRIRNYHKRRQLSFFIYVPWPLVRMAKNQTLIVCLLDIDHQISTHHSSSPPHSRQPDHVTCITDPPPKPPLTFNTFLFTATFNRHSPRPCHSLGPAPPRSSSPQVTAGQQTTSSSTFTASHIAYTQSSSKTLSVKRQATHNFDRPCTISHKIITKHSMVCLKSNPISQYNQHCGPACVTEAWAITLNIGIWAHP